jgi:ubiquinone/menaquinone biosynthesis C-methylase UbiE
MIGGPVLLGYSSGMDLVDLDDAQNTKFNREIHTPDDLKRKLVYLNLNLGRREARVLDLGGGNGTFLDAVLDNFPQSRGTLLDISPSLIAANKVRPDKTVVIGSVAEMEQLLPQRDYDVITVNWLLHHLVGSSYARCGDNCVAALEKCKAVLGPGGMIVVAEVDYDGLFDGAMASRLIYAITSIRMGWVERLLKPLANTVGNGVCFRSRGGWEAIFARAGLKVAKEHGGPAWRYRWWWRLLGIRKLSHRHFYLQRA